jgi:hypothetical protein
MKICTVIHFLVKASTYMILRYAFFSSTRLNGMRITPYIIPFTSIIKYITVKFMLLSIFYITPSILDCWTRY